MTKKQKYTHWRKAASSTNGNIQTGSPHVEEWNKIYIYHPAQKLAQVDQRTQIEMWKSITTSLDITAQDRDVGKDYWIGLHLPRN